MKSFNSINSISTHILVYILYSKDYVKKQANGNCEQGVFSLMNEGKEEMIAL